MNNMSSKIMSKYLHDKIFVKLLKMAFRVLDVSYHNGTIDWNAVKQSDVKAVMIRSSYGKPDPSHVDIKFRENVLGALSAGLFIGIYHYTHATTVSEAEAEAEFVLDIIKEFKDKITLPVAFDIEGEQREALSKDQNTKDAIAFCNKIREAGYTPMMYANLWFSGHHINMDEIRDANIDFWIAQWNSYTQYQEIFTMWQYSSTSKVPGCDGNIDSSWCSKDYTKGLIDFKVNKQKGLNPVYEFTKNSDTDVGELQSLLNLEKTWIPSESTYEEAAKIKISPGESNSFVTWLQKRLTKLNFFNGSINGIFDSETETAVDKFHSFYELQPGIISGIDWYYLIQP